MVFRRRSSPINSLKHVIDSEGALTATKSVSVIAQQTAVRSDPFNPVQVLTGERINAFFITIFIKGSSGTTVNGSQNWYIMKQHAGQAAVVPDPGSTGTSNIRNQIFHEEKGLVGSGDGTAMAFKGVIVVPKGMRRIRDGDIFQLVLLNNGTDAAEFCIKAIYKSFS